MDFKADSEQGDVEGIIDKNLIDAVLSLAAQQHAKAHKEGERFTLEVVKELGLGKRVEEWGRKEGIPGKAGIHSETRESGDTVADKESKERERINIEKSGDHSSSYSRDSDYTHGHSFKAMSKGWVCCSQCGWASQVSELFDYSHDLSAQSKKKDTLSAYAGQQEPEAKSGYEGSNKNAYNG
ncbi:MAG TPA: hypothetical protein VJI75_00770 [Candidatus Nanoarchaeia archaeon]|nr:hypothetical protein [Candidatus Nanoarchaeia archaeon]